MWAKLFPWALSLFSSHLLLSAIILHLSSIFSVCIGTAPHRAQTKLKTPSLKSTLTPSHGHQPSLGHPLRYPFPVPLRLPSPALPVPPQPWVCLSQPFTGHHPSWLPSSLPSRMGMHFSSMHSCACLGLRCTQCATSFVAYLWVLVKILKRMKLWRLRSPRSPMVYSQEAGVSGEADGAIPARVQEPETQASWWYRFQIKSESKESKSRRRLMS